MSPPGIVLLARASHSPDPRVRFLKVSTMALAVSRPRLELTSGLHGFAVQALIAHESICAAAAAAAAAVAPAAEGPRAVNVQGWRIVGWLEAEYLSKEGERRNGCQAAGAAAAHNRSLAVGKALLDEKTRPVDGVIDIDLPQTPPLAVLRTSGNIDDPKPVPQVSKRLRGKLVSDRGFLSQALFERLFARGLPVIAPIRKNMHNRLVVIEDILLTRTRLVL